MLDNNSFEMLVAAQTDTLYRVSMAMLKNEHDAQDAVHDAILIAYANLHKLRQKEYFGTWLTRILINECKKQLRRRKRYADPGDNLPDSTERDNPYLNIELGDLLDRLPEKIRLTMLLHYSEDYSVREIKEILRIPEGTVKSRLSTGRRLMKEMMQE